MDGTVKALKDCVNEDILREATEDEIRLSSEMPDGVFTVKGIGWCYVQAVSAYSFNQHIRIYGRRG